MNPVNPLLFAETSSMAVMDQKLQRMKLPFGLNLKNWLTIPQILRNGFMNLEFKVFLWYTLENEILLLLHFCTDKDGLIEAYVLHFRFVHIHNSRNKDMNGDMNKSVVALIEK